MPPVQDLTLSLLIEALLSIGIGLFVGLEREHSEVAELSRTQGESRVGRESLLGVRTFALLALFGWLTDYFSSAQPWLPIAGLVVVGALAVISALRENERGLTTEAAALTTFVLGMLIHHQRAIAVALGLATTLLLISKPWFRELVPRMRRVDFTATLQLLILLVIVLPLLPVEARDPWQVLSPRRIGVFVALIAGIGYVGYLLNRLLGGSRGAGLTGLIGGLVSSTAVTVAMAQHARRVPAMVQPGQFATLLANTVMLVRVLVVSALISATVTKTLLLPLGAMAVCMLAGALWKWRTLRLLDSESVKAEKLELENPFSLLPALKWGVLLAAILVASALARSSFGDSGFVATAAISGFMDVDAVTLAATRLAASGELTKNVAALAITVAVASNTVVKGIVAWVSGGRAFGGDIAKVFGAALLAGILLAAGRAFA